MTSPAWGDGPVSSVRAPALALEDAATGATRSTVLGQTGAGEVGVWEIDPGTAQDVEDDEFFVVLSGRATISAEGLEAVDVCPGDIVRLRAGAATTWVVTERLRKVYLSW